MNHSKSIINELSEILKEISPNLFPRLIVFDGNEIFFYDKGAMSSHFFVKKNGEIFDWFINSDYPERGQILSNFAQLELLIDEMICAFINMPRLKINNFIEFLSRGNVNNKIRLISKWKIISNSEEKKLIGFKKVRNSFAHQLVPNDVKYKDGYLSDENTYTIFKKDYNEMINTLLLKLKGMQPPLDIILKELKTIAQQ